MPPSARVDSSIRKMVFSSLTSVDVRFDGGIRTVALVHSTVGVGAPDNGIVTEMGSPEQGEKKQKILVFYILIMSNLKRLK